MYRLMHCLELHASVASGATANVLEGKNALRVTQKMVSQLYMWKGLQVEAICMKQLTICGPPTGLFVCTAPIRSALSCFDTRSEYAEKQNFVG